MAATAEDLHIGNDVVSEHCHLQETSASRHAVDDQVGPNCMEGTLLVLLLAVPATRLEQQPIVL